MLASIFQQVYKRDLKKLVHEIESYNDENNLWKVQHQISNSAGNLCLHIIGNLNTYIGLTLGNIPYERKRDLEFSQKDIAREILVKKIYETIQLVETGLSNLPDERISYKNLGRPCFHSYHIVELGHTSKLSSRSNQLSSKND